MQRLLFILMMLFASVAMAQTDSTNLADKEEGEESFEWIKGNMNEDVEFGLRLGTNTTTMFGGELDNPRPMFGLNGAVYYRKKFTPKNAFQIDLAVSLRGSNFDNPLGKYSKLVTYYLDVPVTWVRSINADNSSHFMAGVQYSHLLNTSIYMNSTAVPENERPKLRDNDVMVLAGTQFYGGFVGFQIVAKYGLLNINNGLISGLNPPLKNKAIHNFVLELNLLF
jgi:hypothetical protein